MPKRALVILLFILLLGADARETALPALVISSSEPEYLAVAEGFRTGYSGQVREYNLDGSDKKLRSVADELAANPPPLVVAVGDLAVQMAKQRLLNTPVIYCDSPRAAEFGLPPAQTEGISHLTSPSEQLKLIPQLFPARTRIGLFVSQDVYRQIQGDKLIGEAGKLGLTVRPSVMSSIKDVSARLQAELPQVDLIWIFSDPVVFSSHSVQYVVIQALGAKVPIFCGEATLAKSGATAALVPDLTNAGLKAAQEADKVLKKKSPALGSIIYPEGSLILNAKVAALLNITLPQEALNRAKTVVQ